MAAPDYQSLMLPVLKQALMGEVRIGAVVEALADEPGLTDGDRAEMLRSAVDVRQSRQLGEDLLETGMSR